MAEQGNDLGRVQLVGWRTKGGRFSALTDDGERALRKVSKDVIDLVRRAAELQSPVGVRYKDDGAPAPSVRRRGSSGRSARSVTRSAGRGATGEAMRFKDGWRVQTRNTAGGATSTLSNISPHARLVIEDTKPHWIYPKRAGGWLRWQYPAGRFHFARQVYHPGTTGQDIPAAAWRTVEPTASEMLSRAARTWAADFRAIFS